MQIEVLMDQVKSIAKVKKELHNVREDNASLASNLRRYPGFAPYPTLKTHQTEDIFKIVKKYENKKIKEEKRERR